MTERNSWLPRPNTSNANDPSLRRAIDVLRDCDGDASEVDALANLLRDNVANPANTADVVNMMPSGSAFGSIATRLLMVAAGLGVMAGAWYAYKDSEPSPSAITTPAINKQVLESDNKAAEKNLDIPQPKAPQKAAQVPTTSAATHVAPKRSTAKAQPPRRGVAVRSASPTAELELLRRAQTALNHSPKNALSLVKEHERDYPRGLFSQEREIIAVEANIKLGNLDNAYARAQRFLKQFPRSTHSPRMRDFVQQIDETKNNKVDSETLSP